MAFYVCVGCDAILPGYYEAPAQQQAVTVPQAAPLKQNDDRKQAA